MTDKIKITVGRGHTKSSHHPKPTKVFWAFLDDEAAGYLDFTWDSETQDQSVIHVNNVYVEPAFQRRGVSTALHRAAAEWLAKRGDFRLGSGDVVSKENVAFWKKLEEMGLAKRGEPGFGPTWELVPGALIPNSLLAKPPKASHRLQDTRQFRRFFGRAPRESDYEGVHTTGNKLIAAAYAMGTWNGDPDSYPVIITLDVSGLEPLPDVDAMVHGAAAADELLSSYRSLVKDSGWTLDDFIEDDDYREIDAQAGEEPAAFIFEDVGHHVAQAIRDYAEEAGEDEEQLFGRFINAGELPPGVLMRLAQQQRYLHDFEQKRVVCIEAVKPWWHQVLFGGDEGEADERIAQLEERGFHVFSLEDQWSPDDVGETMTIWEAPNASRRKKTEYHGTTSAAVESAFPGLIPEETPFPIEREE